MSDYPLYFQALLFFAPAGISNMTPLFANKIPLLNKWDAPMDFGKTYRGKRIFGPHKRWRGLITGVVMGTLAGYILHALFFDNYPLANYLFVSVALSAGALIGDAVESFFKRQRGIESGKKWFPFDQTDYIIGALIFALPFAQISVAMVPWIFAWYFGLHLFSSYIGFLIGLKDQPI